MAAKMDELFEGLNKSMEEVAEKYDYEPTYPLTINGVEKRSVQIRPYFRYPTGQLVAVRPCDEKKTYVGILLGEAAIDCHTIVEKPTGRLVVCPHLNPAIFVFSLNKIIYGIESWWKAIENPEQAAEITDDAISQQVQMMLNLLKTPEPTSMT